MTNDVIPSRHYQKLGWITGIVLCFLIAGAGVAAAALRFDAKGRDVILNGISVGGVPVGGLPVTKARAEVTKTFDESLDRSLTIEIQGRYFATSARDLGATTDALARLDEATSLRGAMSIPHRVWLGVTRGTLSKDLDVKVAYNTEKIDSFVKDIEGSVNIPATEPSISFVDGALRIIEGKPGFKLDHAGAVKSIHDALVRQMTEVHLEGKQTLVGSSIGPIKDVLVVKIGENKLLHYQGQELVKTYDVATGMSQYRTPTGTFKIVNKRLKPTWVNPAKYPGGWGFNLPASIPSGPGNPLGTRAMDLNSAGIRIHGTYSAYSMGYNASHGCIRMRIADSEELFDLVPVGTPVLIVQTAAYRPLPSRLRATKPEPIAEADGTQVPGQPQSTPSPSPTATQSPATTPIVH
ncbi:MAG: L,D-transpeptidase family protein [Actinomycetota bacterium]|nr:L,D-transpeptidase/peptidoglycan binding protein [Actinomycetota bacterium]